MLYKSVWSYVVGCGIIVGLVAAAKSTLTPDASHWWLLLYATLMAGFVGLVIAATAQYFGCLTPKPRVNGSQLSIADAIEEAVVDIQSYGIKIITPRQDEVICQRKINVDGSFIIRPPGEWMLLTQLGDKYWPQGPVKFEDKAWRGGVTLSLNQRIPHKILFVEISPELQTAVKHYNDAALWKIGIKLQSESLRVADAISVVTEPAPPDPAPVPAQNDPSPVALPFPISIRHIDIEDARENAKLLWPLKVRIQLHNDSRGPFDVRGAEWIAKSGQAQLHLNPEHGIGWQFLMQGQPEARSLIIPADGRCEIWWGLNPNYPASEIQRMRKASQLGTLVIRALIDGEIIEHRFQV